MITKEHMSLGEVIDSMTPVREKKVPKTFDFGYVSASAGDIIIHVNRMDVEHAFVQYTAYDKRLTRKALLSALTDMED